MDAKRAAVAMAELYVFSAVVEILEGSTAPRSQSGQRAASQIIQLCQKQEARMLAEYDKHTKETP